MSLYLGECICQSVGKDEDKELHLALTGRSSPLSVAEQRQNLSHEIPYKITNPKKQNN